MINHKMSIISFLISRGHNAYEVPGQMIFALINGVKTEWNWKGDSIIIGFGNDNADIVYLLGLIPATFSTRRTHRKKNKTNVIYINKGSSLPNDFHTIVKLIEKINPTRLKHKAKPTINNTFITYDHKSGRNQKEIDTVSPTPPIGINEDMVTKNNHCDCVQLTLDEINILNSLCGTGDYKKADVLFFGNEEGLGGDPILEVINTRKCHYYNDYETVDEFDRSNGHYYVDRSVKDYPLRPEILRYMARIMLYLGKRNGNWFELKDKDPDLYDIIRNYTKKKLCREKTGIISALFELRPLPRLKEGDDYKWPYCLGHIVEQDYLNAFSYVPNPNADLFHRNLAKERLRILKNLICSSQAKTIIGFGAKEPKKRALSIMFPNINFIEHTLYRNQTAYHTEICICDRKIEILLCPFPGQNMNLPALKAAAGLI